MEVQVATDENFKNTIDSNERVAVKYFADWCGSCKLIAPKYKRLAGDERYGDVQFLEINAENNENARKMAGVDNLPYFAIFKNGKLVDGSATSKVEKVEELLNKLV